METLKVLIVAIVVVVCCVLISIGMSPNKVKADYEWFYDQYNSIQSLTVNVANTKDQETQDRMRMVLNNMVAEYNSKSSQITRKYWKSDTLPYHIELETK